MINVTEYLKKEGKYTPKKIGAFLNLQRVKYFIGHENKIKSKRRRTGSYTMFSEDLFYLFVSWLEKKPIPLLNRKEYEVSSFIKSYFKDTVCQYKIDSFVFDWFIPSCKLLIEFNENTHKTVFITEKDKKKKLVIGDNSLFVINEKTVMMDLALLAKTHTQN